MRRGLGRWRAWVAAVAFAAALAACGSDDGGDAAVRGTGEQACRAAPTSRWAAGAPYEPDAVHGRVEEEWLGGLAGGGFADGRVYLYDAVDPTVRVLGPELREIRRFGREGDGPGELRRGRRVAWSRANHLWVDSTGVYVLDDRRLTRFDPDGGYDRSWGEKGGVLAFKVWNRSGPYVAVDVRFGADRFGLDAEGGVLVFGPDGERVAAMAAADPIRAPGGVPWYTPDLAVPFVAAGQGCVVLADGGDDRLVLLGYDGGADTLRIPLPERYAEPVEEEVLRGFLKIPPGRPLPQVEERRRIRSLAVDPDGHVWVATHPDAALEEAGVHEVLVVDPERGVVVRDTVPALPWFFGEAGSYYSVSRDETLGVQRLVRYRSVE